MSRNVHRELLLRWKYLLMMSSRFRFMLLLLRSNLVRKVINNGTKISTTSFKDITQHSNYERTPQHTIGWKICLDEKLFPLAPECGILQLTPPGKKQQCFLSICLPNVICSSDSRIEHVSRISHSQASGWFLRADSLWRGGEKKRYGEIWTAY